MQRDNNKHGIESNLLPRRDFLAAAGAATVGISPTITEANRTPVATATTDVESTQGITSPNGTVRVTFELRDGQPRYSLSFEGATLVEPSPLGFEFRDADSLDDGFEIAGVRRREENTTWEPVWGETAEVRNRYRELVVGLVESASPSRSLTLIFRAYDDGAAFRYVLPEQENFGDFIITDEKTGFRFAGDYTSWWTPDNWENYEYLYEETPLSEISTSSSVGLSDVDAANTPVTMKVDDERYMCVHEAALTDYAAMTLARDGDHATRFESALVPWPDGAKVKAETPHASPWRTFTLGSTPGDLVESKLVLNLNEPNEIEDTSWIDPGKYVGIWWEIHIGKSTWASGPDVGATTANAKRYIDFASEHGIESLLVEGWNVGWDGGFDAWSNPPYLFDFTESIAQYDLEEVVEYGRSKDPSVGITIHNETGGGVGNYIEQLEEAYQYYEELGIHSAKLGYVSEDGLLIDGTVYHHHGQRMVNHYRWVTKKAAEHEIMLDVHEPIKPTGVRRTWPNLLTREGASGLEYENFRPQGNPPSHTLVLPFTRLIGGPFDYTPGIFDVTYEEYGETRVHSTRARQLALYPIIFSGLQMVADLPEKYDDLTEFEFIENVPATWDETTVVQGKIGRYLTIARRKGEEWYVGSGTDDRPRRLNVPLDFLDDGRPYVATIYSDGEDADFETNPTSVAIDEVIVTSEETLVASMVEGGGQAIRLRPAKGEQRAIRRYEPPTYSHDTFTIQDEVTASDPVVATIEATNEGNVVGGEELHLFVDGEPVETRLARVPGGGEEQIDFPVTVTEVGEHEVAVGHAPGDVIASETVEVTPKSAEFGWLAFDGFDAPETATTGEPIEIAGTVTNTGGDETIQILKLTVDGRVVATKKVDLEPDEGATVTFEHAFESGGTFELALEGLGPWSITVTPGSEEFDSELG
ncbi:glycoside hydrolase family 97 catalytic domain-containing protein [Haladaptatus halobius]|uniref:glycoside hydrolase family 97 catalytic domain-containing protein n=1 Tax=Haladaptatus halobius TaxID=2884875 RepID=UPI001D0AF8F5|nr:glycoside hydrolase family 97 catalytic domain-containing protein [Haladaptatus halobius]